MFVNLYTTRLLMKALGVEDYGVYNVVGSILVMFSSIKGLFISSTQRFLNYAIGQNNEKNANLIFCTSINIHILICLIFFLIIEPAGMWFINYKLVLPQGNYLVANIIFQFSVISSLLTILTVPYEAVLIAKQKMNVYASLSIIDVLLKLCATATLLLMPQDYRLTVYALFILIIAFIGRFISYLYCKRYDFCTYRFIKDKKLLKEMGSFAGWNFLGNMTFSLSNEGQNLILNTFFGPVVNASRAIAYQIRSVLYQLTSNMSMAFKPHITHLYAQGNYAEMTTIAQYALKYSEFLVILISVPLYIYIDEILRFWLTNVPEYTSTIVKCIVFFILIKPLLAINDDVIKATGKLKGYQISTSVTTFLFFLISWLYLYYDTNVSSVFIIQNIGASINLIIIYIIIKQHKVLKFNKYLKHTILNCIIPVLSSFTIAIIINSYLLSELGLHFVAKALIIDTAIILYLLVFHTSKNEKYKIINAIIKK